MAENPCCSKKDFKYFVATFLPDLYYYEYRTITSIEKKLGDEIFHDDYLMMLEEEKIELGRKYKIEMEEYEAQMNSKSFVEYLNTRKLFDSFFENDPEGSAFLLIEEEVTKLYINFEGKIVGLCKDIFRMGQTQHEIRQKNFDDFNDSINSIQKQSQDEAIGHMELFLEEKAKIFDELKNISRQLNIDPSKKIQKKVIELKERFVELTFTTWKELMKLETVLYDQMMELNEIYEHTFSDLISNFIEQAQGMFVTMRDVVGGYNDSLQEIAQTYYATVVFEEEEAEKDRVEAEKKKKEEEQKQKQAALKAVRSGKKNNTISNEHETEIEVVEVDQLKVEEEETPRQRVPADLRPFVKDRETLMNALAGSRDVHLLMVDNREDLLVSRAREWQEEAIKSLFDNEIKRNRDKVLEINHFLEVQNIEFRLLLSELGKLSNIGASDSTFVFFSEKLRGSTAAEDDDNA